MRFFVGGGALLVVGEILLVEVEEELDMETVVLGLEDDEEGVDEDLDEIDGALDDADEAVEADVCFKLSLLGG